MSIDAIYKTRPGGSNLTDQLIYWANQAEVTVPVPGTASSARVPIDLSGVPSVTKGTIQQRRREVGQMFDHPDSPDAQARGKAAVDWLKEHIGQEPNVVDGALRGWKHT